MASLIDCEVVGVGSGCRRRQMEEELNPTRRGRMGKPEVRMLGSGLENETFFQNHKLERLEDEGMSGDVEVLLSRMCLGGIPFLTFTPSSSHPTQSSHPLLLCSSLIHFILLDFIHSSIHSTQRKETASQECCAPALEPGREPLNSMLLLLSILIDNLQEVS